MLVVAWQQPNKTDVVIDNCRTYSSRRMTTHLFGRKKDVSSALNETPFSGSTQVTSINTGGVQSIYNDNEMALTNRVVDNTDQIKDGYDTEGQNTAFDILKYSESKASPVILDINDVNLDWGSTQVIIDIDDTIKSSGGYSLFNVHLGGIDTQYERGELYPGSFQFILELSTYKIGSKKKPLMLAVLTTRIPQVPITSDSLLNTRFKQVAERRGFKNWGIDCQNKILYSTFKEWVWYDTRGEKKFVNFKQLHKYVSDQNQDVRYIWIGDTGDKDLEAGEMMIKHFPGRIRAVFMHYVNHSSHGNFSKSIPNDYYLKSVPVLFFRLDRI